MGHGGNAATIYYPRIFNGDSYKIPVFQTYYVPQGLCKVTYKKKTYRLITAYDHTSKHNSIIYVLDSNGNNKKLLYIKDSKGQHVGGITEYKGYVFIASNKRVYAIGLSYVIDMPNGTTLTADIITNDKISNEFTTETSAHSFCTTYDDMLWIGNFNTSKLTCAYGYKFSYNKDKKILLTAKAKIKGVPKKCQGMTFDKNRVYFATSWGILDSKIYIYTYAKQNRAVMRNLGYLENTIKAQIPIEDGTLYTLYKKVQTITAPSGAENIYLTANGNLYVLFESGADYFKKKWPLIPRTIENRVVLIDL